MRTNKPSPVYEAPVKVLQRIKVKTMHFPSSSSNNLRLWPGFLCFVTSLLALSHLVHQNYYQGWVGIVFRFPFPAGQALSTSCLDCWLPSLVPIMWKEK